jgi:hypothetical protein
MIRLASIFGGTSTYLGMLRREVDNLICLCLQQGGPEMKLIVPLPMSRTELREGQVTAESPKTPCRSGRECDRQRENRP